MLENKHGIVKAREYLKDPEWMEWLRGVAVVEYDPSFNSAEKLALKPTSWSSQSRVILLELARRPDDIVTHGELIEILRSNSRVGIVDTDQPRSYINRLRGNMVFPDTIATMHSYGYSINNRRVNLPPLFLVALCAIKQSEGTGIRSDELAKKVLGMLVVVLYII